jgi:hypothetical protein
MMERNPISWSKKYFCCICLISVGTALSVGRIFSIFVFWECLLESCLVEITLNKSKILIGNVCRPSSWHRNLTQTEQFAQSLEIFSKIANQIIKSNVPYESCGRFQPISTIVTHRWLHTLISFFSFGLLQDIAHCKKSW